MQERGLCRQFKEYTPEHLKNSKVLKPLPPLNRNLYLTVCAKPMRNEIFDNIRWLDASFAVNKDRKQTYGQGLYDRSRNRIDAS